MGKYLEDIFNKDLISKIHKKLLQINKNITIQFQNGQRISIDIFPKETYTWSTGTCEDDQYH